MAEKYKPRFTIAATEEIFMQKITIAGIQMAAQPNQVAQNIANMVKWIEKAMTKTKAQMLVFPETITTGFVPNVTVPQLWESIDTLPGQRFAPVFDAAKHFGVYIVFPTYERGPNPNIVYNSAALIDPQGQLVGVYRKTHPFPTEKNWTTPGTTAPVFNTPLGKIGIVICYDGDFPELSRVMALQGVEILIRPSAFLRSAEIWSLTTRARAYDNHTYMVAVNAVGTDAAGSLYFGNSMIVSPLAQVLAQARSQEEIVWATLDPQPLTGASYGIDSPMLFHHLEDRNIASYQGILQNGPAQFPRNNS